MVTSQFDNDSLYGVFRPVARSQIARSQRGTGARAASFRCFEGPRARGALHAPTRFVFRSCRTMFRSCRVLMLRRILPPCTSPSCTSPSCDLRHVPASGPPISPSLFDLTYRRPTPLSRASSSRRFGQPETLPPTELLPLSGRPPGPGPFPQDAQLRMPT